MDSIRQMRDICQIKAINRRGKIALTGHWYNKYFTRHFSIYFTWLFVRIGVSANAITIASIVIGIIGSLLCIPHVLWMTLLGIFWLYIFELFDCVDGEVARWTKKSSVKGLYLDLISHVLCNHVAKILCPLHLYMFSGEVKYLVLAFITYAASSAEHGISTSFAYIRKTLPENLVNMYKYSSCNTKRQKAYCVAQAAFNMSLRPFNVKLVSFVLICFSYVGSNVPLGIFSWFYAIYSIVALLGRIMLHFKLQLPDIEHNKEV